MGSLTCGVAERAKATRKGCQAQRNRQCRQPSCWRARSSQRHDLWHVARRLYLALWWSDSTSDQRAFTVSPRALYVSRFAYHRYHVSLSLSLSLSLSRLHTLILCVMLLSIERTGLIPNLGHCITHYTARRDVLRRYAVVVLLFVK